VQAVYAGQKATRVAEELKDLSKKQKAIRKETI
jgi:hypothetical protein